MEPDVSAETARPLLRGWQHAVMFPVAFVAGVVLVASAPTMASRISAAIFAATAALQFGVSGLLHRGTWSPGTESLLRRIDHASIYLIIAGTYTPFAVLALPEDEGRLLLTMVWTGAFAGVAFRVFWVGAPRWLSTALYVAVGWMVLFFLPDLVVGAGIGVVGLIAFGGVFYTLGAIVYATKWPRASQRVYGFHEVFHTLTVVALAVHYVAVWIVVQQ